MTGTDGSTVFGEPIPRKKKVSVQVGRNLLEGKGKVVAQQPGGLRLIDNVLSVEPLLEVRGDSDNVAPINFDGDATFRGSISEGRIVQISGSLNVSGAIEAIQLNTGGSVIAQGGIIGKQKGKYAIGGDLRCRFVSGGLLTVGKDVLVQSDITEARHRLRWKTDRCPGVDLRRCVVCQQRIGMRDAGAFRWNTHADRNRSGHCRSSVSGVDPGAD